MSNQSNQEFDSPRIYALNQSCNEKIQNDSINAHSTDCKLSEQLEIEVKLTRSQKQAGSMDEALLLEEMKKQWIRTEKAKHEEEKIKEKKKKEKIFIRTKNENKTPPDFGTDILESESVSVDEDIFSKLEDNKPTQLQRYKSQSHKGHEKKQKNMPKKNIKINILLVGRSGIGKTSFIDSFCSKKYEPITAERERTLTMKSYRYEEVNQVQEIEMSLIDLPGYQQLNIEDYIYSIEKMIFQGFERHLRFSKDKKNGGSKSDQDSRIHCCIFFIAGPWINQSQWIIMKRIESMINIIPVIAKGDTFTTSELKQLKRKIEEKRKAENINWFSLEEIIRQNYHEKLNRLINGSFGKSPPFVIACGTQKIYNEQTKAYELGRDYRWGKCQLNNQEHNDFKFLKQLLVEYLSDALVNFTDLMEKRYIEVKGKEKSEIIDSEQSLEFSGYKINRSHRQEPQNGSDIIEQQGFSNVTRYIQYGLTFLGAGYIVYLYWKSNSSKT